MKHELEIRLDQLRAAIANIDARFPGERLPDDERARWNELNEEYEETERAWLDHKAKIRRIEELARDARHLESPVSAPEPGRRYDFSERQMDALRAVDRLQRDGELPEAAILRLDFAVRGDGVGHDLAYVAAVSSPHYRDAFLKVLRYGTDSVKLNLTEKEREAVEAVQEACRAASLTTTAGGFAVPTVLDPTVIPTGDGTLNPLRQIARVETVTSETWKGVTSAGVTAGYAPEATEASDNAPELAQPEANVEKAFAFVPFSIEIGQDWGAFEAEMSRMFRDARDELEATKFLSGLGHASNEPEGLLVGGTLVVETSAATTVGIGDAYSLVEALPARYRPRARVVASAVTFNRFRRLIGPGSTEPPVWQDSPAQFLRVPALELSTMSEAVTSGASVVTYGDFTNFLIADRIGMQVELVPHLFGSSNRFPTGQRGLYAWWRNTSKVLTPTAFRTLKVK